MSQIDEFIPKIVDIENFVKPNVRKMFVPDMGHTLFDADLMQSDAQIVAWEADDEPLKEGFRAQLLDPSAFNLHTQNAKDIYGLVTREPTKHERQMAKHGVHATNFGAKPATMAKKLDMTVGQASAFQTRWFKLHPAIPKWHRRVEAELMQTRTITNAFGYRRIFFDRIESVLPEALAWVPQSTTVNVIDKGLLNIKRTIPEIELLIQVHDSLVGQFKNALYPTMLPRIYSAMLIPIPYDDPLTINVEIACSRKSWGDVKGVPSNDDRLFCPY